MSTELIIHSAQEGRRLALIRDKSLIEYHLDNDNNQFSVGDIFLGTVKKVVAGLNAAFIDVGYEKDAFLHYLDLGPKVRTLNKYTKLALTKKNTSYKLSKFRMEQDIDKLGKITNVLNKGQQILVQVVKEPISTKGPRLSCELSIAGRYLVLVPFSNIVNVSRKITSSEERKRLQRLVNSIRPTNFGVIIRTVADGKDVAELDRDLSELVERWEEGIKALKTAKPREKIIGEMNKSSSLLRDMLNESFDSIIVDEQESYQEVKDFIQKIAPDKARIVKKYNGKQKIFEQYGVERQIKLLFGKSVSLPNGGYLIIEHTEAMHVIDVNSGNKSNKEENQEDTALTVNLEATREVARQLRLRDMGGIVIIDFIDMRKAENKKKVFDQMKKEMKDDRSKYTILPLTKFGLLQITRQRVRPEHNIITQEVCPSCEGTGKVSPTLMITDSLEKDLEIITKSNTGKLSIAMHPFIYTYYKSGVISRRTKWFFKYNKWINLIKDSSLGITEYMFMDSNGQQIEMN